MSSTDSVRTTPEICALLAKATDKYRLAYSAVSLLPFLSMEDVRKLFSINIDIYDWKQKPLTRGILISEVQNILRNIWPQLLEHETIKARKARMQLTAYMWLLKDKENMVYALDEGNWPQLGAPIFDKIGSAYGIDCPDEQKLVRMSMGFRCTELCARGCVTPITNSFAEM